MTTTVQSPAGFTCTKCGDCCRGFSDQHGVILFPQDVSVISKGLEMSEIDFISKYCTVKTLNLGKQVDVYYLKHKDGTCLFLENNECSIHQFKPTQCERGPFGFFWHGTRYYDCMKTVELPVDWSSEQGDREIVKALLAEDA